jgi:hydroxymethylglutaryl-CoA synthase
MTGLVSYAAYLPRYRLAGADVGLRRGDRVVAGFDPGGYDTDAARCRLR